MLCGVMRRAFGTAVVVVLASVCRAAAPGAPAVRARNPEAPATRPEAVPAGPLLGFTLHFDFLDSMADAERLVRFAVANGATILNVVPPAHIWEDPGSVATLRRIFALTREAGVAVVLNRIDASYPSRPGSDRLNWLYQNVLTERGRLPDGRPTPDFFLATVGKPDYERWLRDETAYYAEHFSNEENLLGFSLGPFNEPFVSQRGSLLCFDLATDSYEIGQYTPYAAAEFHRFLERRYGDPAAMNRRYRTAFATFDSVPMPRNETDPMFGNSAAAYWDFVSSIDAWVVRQLDACRTLWRARARRDVPFLLQLSGYLPEKLEKGRPAFAALDVFEWMTHADALGLSLYTNCEYPDWGHASDRAMASYLRLGELLGKRVFVLEAGSECAGAVLDRRELRFIAATAASLRPASVIYEFLKETFYERAARRNGKILSDGWTVRRRTLAAVRTALEASRQAPAGEPPAWVLDDPRALADSPDALDLRRALARLAMVRPLAFVPPAAVDALPAGGTLYVLLAAERDALAARLAGRRIEVRLAAELVGGGPGRERPAVGRPDGTRRGERPAP